MKTRAHFLTSTLLIGLLSLGGLGVSSCATIIAPIAAGSASASTTQSPLRQRVDAMASVLQDGVNKNVAAGFAVALTDNAGRTEKAFIGLADKEAGRAITNDTVYRLYSMTKPVTAVAIMMLVEDGKIDLDVPLATYIPSFANAKVYVSGETMETLRTAPLERPLTVRDLMRQTSGMPYFGAGSPVEKLFYAAGIERAPGEAAPGLTGRRVATLQELADRVAATPLSSQPGVIYTYGSAIDVLGRVVEVGSGQTLGAFFQSRIFAPLGMKDTAFNVQTADKSRLASGYFSKSPKPFISIRFPTVALSEVPVGALTLAEAGTASIYHAPARIEFGGSGLVGTLDDYVLFARMIANNGALDGKRLLKATTITEMGRDQLGEQASERLRAVGSTYGLGFGRIVDTPKSNSGAPAGTMYWAGAAGTYFWANPQTRESGVLMTQVFGDNINVYQGAAMRAAHGVSGN